MFSGLKLAEGAGSCVIFGRLRALLLETSDSFGFSPRKVESVSPCRRRLGARPCGADPRLPSGPRCFSFAAAPGAGLMPARANLTNTYD